jgi:hypothetical protein
LVPDHLQINSVIGIFVHLIYATNRGMHNNEHNAISNRIFILKLLVWKLPEKLIIGFSFHWNNNKPILINKPIKELKYNEEVSLSFEIKSNIRMIIKQTISIHLSRMKLPYKKEMLNFNFIEFSLWKSRIFLNYHFSIVINLAYVPRKKSATPINPFLFS